MHYVYAIESNAYLMALSKPIIDFESCLRTEYGLLFMLCLLLYIPVVP